MQNHYHPALLRSGRDSVPRILGLTASPVVQSKKNELESVTFPLTSHFAPHFQIIPLSLIFHLFFTNSSLPRRLTLSPQDH